MNTPLNPWLLFPGDVRQSDRAADTHERRDAVLLPGIRSGAEHAVLHLLAHHPSMYVRVCVCTCV